MRMWKVDPRVLCRQHLLGEHLEMHMFLGAFKKGTNLLGYVKKHLVEVHNIPRRHRELAEEIARRGWNHKSPMDEIKLPRVGNVFPEASIEELKRRCEQCRKRIEEVKE